jgi:hypothetical protein
MDNGEAGGIIRPAFSCNHNMKLVNSWLLLVTRNSYDKTMQKILVVDDEKKIVDIVKAYLEKDGFRVIAAYDGQAAVDMAKNESPEFNAAENIRLGCLPYHQAEFECSHHYAYRPR